MTVCRFFQQGYCRYGSNCRFEHTNPYKYNNYNSQQSQQQYSSNAPSSTNVTPEQLHNQVLADVTASLDGRQWMLSCYSPFKSKPNFPGLQDISPEEVRLKVYEARLNGSLPQTESELARCSMEYIEKYKMLIKPTKNILNVLEAIFRNESSPDPFQSNASMGFSQSSNIFGGGSANTGTNVFGGSNVSTGANIFGGGSPTSSSNASSLFAEAAQNLFQSSSPFGVAPSQPFATSGGGFSTQMESSAQPSNFNNNIFGGAQSFTNQPVQQNQFSSFEPSRNTAFNSSGVSPSDLFSSANLALGPAPNQPSNVFGQVNQQSLETKLLSQNPFSAIPTQPSENSLNYNPFMASNNMQNNFFNIDDTPPIEGIYSKMEDLSEKDIAAFKSETFQRGSIPVVPPPLELCT